MLGIIQVFFDEQMNIFAPEEIELEKKRKMLERLKETLATREEEMTHLHAKLEQFEARYTMEVGRLLFSAMGHPRSFCQQFESVWFDYHPFLGGFFSSVLIAEG